jgi:hypothetical protein
MGPNEVARQIGYITQVMADTFKPPSLRTGDIPAQNRNRYLLYRVHAVAQLVETLR